MDRLLKEFEKNKNELNNYKIIIVANVRNHTGKFKSISLNQANPIEFFSDDEFDEICNAIYNLKIFTKIYYNELDFIEDILNKTYQLDKIIVINFARNGVIEGKKSLIPAFCDLVNVKYTTNNAFVQSLCRDKYVWGCVLNASELPALHNTCFYKNSIVGIDNIDNYCLHILKPKAESSSLNVSKVLTKSDIFKIVNQSNNDFLIAQKYLCGDEIEVPFFELNGDYYIQEPAKINYTGDILNENLSEENNYYYSDSNLSSTQISDIKEITLKVAQILGMKKYGRIDFKCDENGKYYIIDIATLPYLTKNSSFAYAAKKQNLDYDAIFKILVIIAYLSKIS